MAGGLELGAAVGGAPVLPDQCGVDGLAGRAVPGDDRLALVGDADRGDLAGTSRRVDHSWATASVFAQISAASCSTWPGAG